MTTNQVECFTKQRSWTDQARSEIEGKLCTQINDVGVCFYAKPRISFKELIDKIKDEPYYSELKFHAYTYGNMKSSNMLEIKGDAFIANEMLQFILDNFYVHINRGNLLLRQKFFNSTVGMYIKTFVEWKMIRESITN